MRHMCVCTTCRFMYVSITICVRAYMHVVCIAIKTIVAIRSGQVHALEAYISSQRLLEHP